MFVEIEKIVVDDRIRKDYGNLQELADNISENTLMNPPVVMPNGDGTYTLIAGERRLRAMRDILGYMQTEVNVVTPRDAEQMLLMEISENECRKEFTMTERLDYAAKIKAVESAKAKERQGTRTDLAQDFVQSERNQAANAVADAIGTNRETLRQAQIISDNRDLLDPADFAEWDEGKLSTNKAFQRIKAAQKRAEEERDAARKDAEEVSELYGKTVVQRDQAESERKRIERELRKASITQTNLEMEAESLRQQLAQRPDPEVIEREVEVEVEVESKEAQRRIRELEHEVKIYLDTDQKLRKQLESTRKELDRAKGIIGMDKSTKDVQRDVEYLISATNQYVRHYGGLTWTFERIAEVDETTREELRKAVRNLATFSNALMGELEQM